MKKLLLLSALIIFGLADKANSQTLENGLSLYEQGDYERAILILQEAQDPEARLFTGKSYFSLNNPLMALQYLRDIDATAPLDVYYEALYTSAMAHFQLDDFSTSLDVLKDLIIAENQTSVSAAAIQMYDQVLGYLTINQRRQAFRESKSDMVRLDLVESMIGRVNYSTAVSFLDLYKKSVRVSDPLRVSRIEAQLRDSVTYFQQYKTNQAISAPRGMSYNLGVLLPEFEFETPEYEIPQHLYFGIQLAVEEFNSQNVDQKVFITYKNTNSDSLNADAIMNDLAWKDDVDVIIGPLFSQVAAEFAGLAEDYEIPMLLPLANADSLDLYNNFVFQFNPSFESQGKQMARYAVNVLEFDSLGVIAEANSLGAPAARAFRHEAQRLGAFVTYYFEENLEDQGYDIRDYTQFFTTDTLDSVDMVHAVFAPFTGTIAPTLIESMLTDLEAMRSTVAILGSEEWMNVDLENRRLADTELYYTESFSIDTTLKPVNDFASSFRVRFNTEPNQFAYIGYDNARIVLQTLLKVKNPAFLRDELKELHNFRGLSKEVSFDGTHVNQDVVIKRMPRNSDEMQALESPGNQNRP